MVTQSDLSHRLQAAGLSRRPFLKHGNFLVVLKGSTQCEEDLTGLPSGMRSPTICTRQERMKISSNMCCPSALRLFLFDVIVCVEDISQRGHRLQAGKESSAVSRRDMLAGLSLICTLPIAG